MAHPPEKRTEVRTYYVRHRLSLSAAADRAGIPRNTAGAWKQKAIRDGDDWDMARNAARLADGGLDTLTTQVLEDFATLLLSTTEQIKQAQKDGGLDPLKGAEAMSRVADAYTKTMKAATRASPNLARHAIAMETLDTLAQFIKARFPADLEQFVVILDAFGPHLSKALSA